MKISGVTIHLGRGLTPAMIRRQKPDVLVVASGAEPVRLRVPGIDMPHVLSAWDVLSEKACAIGRNVVVVGGSATGCETAHFIASMGAPDAETLAFLMYHRAEDPGCITELMHSSARKITVIEMAARIADNVGRSARWSLLKSLRLRGVDLRPGATLLEITAGAVIVNTGRGRESIPADTVIMAVGARPVNSLASEKSPNGTRVIVIGDARTPRKITDAVREGFEEALRV